MFSTDWRGWKPLVLFLPLVVVVTGLTIVALQEFDSRADDNPGGFTSTSRPTEPGRDLNREVPLWFA